MNKEKIEYKMYIKDLNTNQESEEIDLYDFIFNDDEIEFEFGMYGTDEYSILPYKDFKFYINDYGIKIYSPQLEKLQQENKQLKERIDKAIEYLEEHYSDFPDGMKENYDEETIKILRGDSNE